MKAFVTSPSLSRPLIKAGAMPRYVAGFDSTSAMVRALSRFLHSQDFPGMGMNPLRKRSRRSSIRFRERRARYSTSIAVLARGSRRRRLGMFGQKCCPSG